MLILYTHTIFNYFTNANIFGSFKADLDMLVTANVKRSQLYTIFCIMQAAHATKFDSSKQIFYRPNKSLKFRRAVMSVFSCFSIIQFYTQRDPHPPIQKLITGLETKWLPTSHREVKIQFQLVSFTLSLPILAGKTLQGQTKMKN